MLQTRMVLIRSSSIFLMLQARWATRYAVCRRQFKNQSQSKDERKLIDY